MPTNDDIICFPVKHYDSEMPVITVLDDRNGRTIVKTEGQIYNFDDRLGKTRFDLVLFDFWC